MKMKVTEQVNNRKPLTGISQYEIGSEQNNPKVLVSSNTNHDKIWVAFLDFDYNLQIMSIH